MTDTNGTDLPEPEVRTIKNDAREAAALIPVTQRGVEPQDFAQVVDRAKYMATAKEAVPVHLRNNIGMCIAIQEMAMEFGMRPYGVANLCYVVNNRLAFEAQLMVAVINKHAGLKERLRPIYEGEGDNLVCIIRGQFTDEVTPCEYTSPAIGTITPKNSPLWKTDPPRQLFYYSARAFIRMFAPQVMLGIYGRDEIMDNPHIGADNALDVTEASAALHERLTAAKTEGADGFRDGVVEHGLNGGTPDAQAAPPIAETPPGTAEVAPTPGNEPPGTPAARKRRGPAKAKDAPKPIAGAPPCHPDGFWVPGGVSGNEGVCSICGSNPKQWAALDHPAGERMTEAELIDGLKPLTAVADLAECKTAPEYIAYATAWIDAATDKLQAQGRWDDEMDTRAALKVPISDRVRLQTRIDTKFTPQTKEKAT